MQPADARRCPRFSWFLTFGGPFRRRLGRPEGFDLAELHLPLFAHGDIGENDPDRIVQAYCQVGFRFFAVAHTEEEVFQLDRHRIPDLLGHQDAFRIEPALGVLHLPADEAIALLHIDILPRYDRETFAFRRFRYRGAGGPVFLRCARPAVFRGVRLPIPHAFAERNFDCTGVSHDDFPYFMDSLQSDEGHVGVGGNRAIGELLAI